MYVGYTNSWSVHFFLLLNSYVCRLSKILSVWIFWHVLTWIFWHVTQFGPKAPETISQRRFLPKLFICKRKIHHKSRKRFFRTVSIRSESFRNDFSEKVFVKIKMIHISMLSYSLNSVRKHLKWFLEKVFVKITQFRVSPSSVSIDYSTIGSTSQLRSIIWFLLTYADNNVCWVLLLWNILLCLFMWATILSVTTNVCWQ